MKTPLNSTITGLFALFLLIGTTAGSLLYAEPQYFCATPTNSETGAPLGRSINSDTPPLWPSLHSQFSGEILNQRLRVASTAGANWTFLWTRAANDTHSYKMTPSFNVEKDFSGHVALQIGFDGVFDHAQIPWPKGYWVSIESEFNSPLATTSLEAGASSLQNAGKPVFVPSVVTKVYVRVIVTDSSETGKFAWINSGIVTFSATNSDSDATTTPSP